MDIKELTSFVQLGWCLAERRKTGSDQSSRDRWRRQKRRSVREQGPSCRKGGGQYKGCKQRPPPTTDPGCNWGIGGGGQDNGGRTHSFCSVHNYRTVQLGNKNSFQTTWPFSKQCIWSVCHPLYYHSIPTEHSHRGGEPTTQNNRADGQKISLTVKKSCNWGGRTMGAGHTHLALFTTTKLCNWEIKTHSKQQGPCLNSVFSIGGTKRAAAKAAGAASKRVRVPMSAAQSQAASTFIVKAACQSKGISCRGCSSSKESQGPQTCTTRTGSSHIQGKGSRSLYSRYLYSSHYKGSATGSSTHKEAEAATSACHC
eukprot:6490409-Amphidinium_carterae.1